MEKMSARKKADVPRVASDDFEALIGASGARLCDQISIAGRGRLDLLVNLCRRGFAHADCRAQCRGPKTGEPTDVLLVPGIANDDELVSILTQTARDLRAGGVLAVRDARRGRRADSLRQLLTAHGFALSKAAAGIFCARKVDAMALATAA